MFDAPHNVHTPHTQGLPAKIFGWNKTEIQAEIQLTSKAINTKILQVICSSFQTPK